MIRKIFALLAVLAGLNVAQAATYVATRNVSGTTKNYPTVKAAIAKALAGETITIIATCENDFGATNITFSVEYGYVLTLKGGDYSQCKFTGDGTTSITGGTYDFDPSSWLTDGYSATKSGDIWTVAEASGHEHQWKYDDSKAGELTASCTNLNGTCVLSGQSFTLSMTCAGKTYDGEPVKATVAKKAFEDATGLTVGGIVYKQGDAALKAAPVNAGDYTAEVTAGDYTVSVAFTIAPMDITDATVTLSATSFNFDGTEKNVSAASVKLNETTLKAEDYEPDAASVTAATKPGTYTAIVKGKGNYTGTASATWEIVGPTGEFGQVTTATAGWTVEGATNRVTDSTKLVCKDGKWTMSMAVEIPHPNQSLGVYLVHPDPLLHFDAPNSVALSGSDIPILAGSYSGKTDIKSFTWTESFTLAEIQAAEAEGVLRKTLTVYEPVYSETVTLVGTLHNNGGLRETEFVMEVPLEGLVLRDEEGFQVYPEPEHTHDWTCEADGATLTATCNAGGCPVGTTNVTLKIEDFEYGAVPQPSVENGLLGLVRGMKIGEVGYTCPDYSDVGKWYTGDYTAVVTVTVNSVDYELRQDFSITKPAAGYTSGYEVDSMGVRFDDISEALARIGAEDTVFVRDDLNRDEINFTSDKDVTINLCEKTLTRQEKESQVAGLKLRNDGKGTVTLINGTLDQPLGHYWAVAWIPDPKPITVAGKFVFGEGLSAKNEALLDGEYISNYLKITADALTVAGGLYQCEFVALNGGKVAISGGTFTKDPSGFLADGCIVKPIDEGDYKFRVINHTHDYSYTVDGNAITVKCNGTGEACEYAAPRTATLAVTTPVTYTGKPYAGATIETSAAFPEDAPTLAYCTNGVKLASAPVNAGEYAVVMSAGDKAVTNELTITAADLESATLTLTANELKYTGEEQIVGVKSVTINGATLALGKDYFVDESSTLKAVGAFASTETYTITIRACVGGNVTGTASATWKIVSSPRELGAATKTVTGGNATYASDKRTLQIADGTGWKYYPAKDAPDGSGVEGWYAGLKVTWPDDIDVNWANLLASRLLYTRPEDARFTVGAIKEGEAKRIFSGTNSIPGVSVGTKGIDFDDLKLTSVSSFTWWERLTLSDLRAAKREGKDAIEPRTLTAWGTIWGESVDLGILGEFKYGDPNGVRPTTYTIAAKVKANGEDIRLYDGEGNLVWPEHAHEWIYTASDTAVTARCAIAGCRYDLHPAVVELSANPTKKLCDGTPLAATLDGAENFADVTEATVGGILYSGTSYRYDGANRVTTPYSSELPPAEPGTYRADATTTLTNGTTYALSLSLAITNGLVSIGGRHYETAAEVLEKQTAEALDIVVWQGFTAEKTYVLPKDGVKVLDLDGKTIAAPIGETTVLTNLGTLTIADSQGVGGTTKKGQLYGDIVNQGTLVITGGYFDGTIVNDGGTVQISRGKFKVRPDAGWIVSGSDIVNRSGLYCVEPHVHDYGFIRVGSVLFATCKNILADWSLTVTHCDAREVVFFLSPMRETQVGLFSVNLPTSSLVYNGSGQGVELTGINLSALQELSRRENLTEYGDIVRKILALAAKGQNNPTLIADLIEILRAIGDVGDFDVNDLIVKPDEVAAVTGLKLGEIAYSQNGVKLDGEPVNAGSYRAEITVTTPEGKTETLPANFTIARAPIDGALVVCNPLGRKFTYEKTEQVIRVTTVRLGGIVIDGYKSVEEIVDAFENGRLTALDLYNIFMESGTTVKGLISDLWNLVIGKITIAGLFEKLEEAFAGVKLEEGVDYTVGGVTNATDIGAYVLTVDGAGNYQGTIPIDWTITYDHNGKGHDWAYTLDGAKLTATCQTSRSCLISPAVLELVGDAGVEKAFDNTPITASLSNEFAFVSYTGVKVGEVYYMEGETLLPAAPVAVGAYYAKADVEISAGVTNTLALKLAITVPEGGFTDGYEVRASGAAYGVRHDTFAEALAAAKTGDTIFAHDGISGKDLDFTTDADVTIDLCEKTLTAAATSTLIGNNDMTFRNAGAGTVTFVNGTIRQPLHYILGRQNADRLTIASGTFVFGEKLATANVATAQLNYFTVTVADGASLWVADGKHDAKFAGEVEITGGSFWSNFDPTPFLPEGRITRPDPEDATRTVIVEHWHNVVATAEGDTISMFCRAEGDCDLKTPATVTLSVAAETVYNGQPVAATVTKVGNPVYTLAYFTDEDPRVALAGAPTASGAYVAVLSMGEASVEKRFAIIPDETRPFGAVTSAIEGVGTLKGNVLTVTDSLKLDYDPADQTWSAGLAIAVPHTRWSYSLSGGYTPPVYTDAEHLSVSVPDEVELQTKMEGVKIDLLRIDLSYEYVDAVLWMPRFTAEDVQRAIEAGQDSLTFELTLSAGVWEYDISGLTETTYTIVVPLADLVLNDERGVQIYPEHDHDWAFSSEDGVLTATCGTADCPQGTLTLVLAAADKAFDHRPLVATLAGTDAFELHTGAAVGEIVYVDAEGRTLAAAPSLVGEYAAQVTVTPVGDDPVVFAKAFAITVPEGGFTDGYEVNGVCYDTFAEALAAAGAGDTLYLREPLGNQALLDFTSDKNVTIDLCGQTLTYERSQAAASDLTIQNVSTGIVTLVHGTIVQPRGQSRQGGAWQNVYYDVDVTGPFVFGEGLETEKRGTAFTVTANALAITGGAYESALAGELTITGGTFASDPGEFVPAGYMAVEDEGAWVVINHTHAYTYAAEGQTIVRTCVGGPDACPDAPVSITLSVAAEAAYTGNPVAVTVTPSNAFDYALAYYAADDLDTPLDGAPADVGEYAVVMTAGGAAVTNFFAITPVALTSLALAEGAFVCDGTPKTNAVEEVRAGAFTLTADDYTVAGDGLVQTGALFSDTTYTVIVRGTGNFTGAATNTWAILASSEAFEAWRNLYFRADLADFGLNVPLNAKAVKAEGLPAGLKLVKTAVKDAAGKTTVGYRYVIEGVPTELMDHETRSAYVRITDAAGVQTLWPLVLRVSEPEPGEDVEGTVGSPDLVIGGESNALFRVTKIWSDAEIGWTYKGWPSGVTYDKDTGYFRGTPKKTGRYTLTATSGKVGSTTYKNVRTATFTVWADADGELSELTGQAYVAQTNGMDRFGAVKSVTGLPTGLKFTAKGVTDRTYGAIPSNTVYGLPTKAGTFAVTLTLADKSKKSLLWTIAPAVAPACEVVLGDEADTPVERRRAQLVRGSARRYEIATSDPKATVTVTGLPSGLTLKKTAVKDAAGKTAGYTYALEGVPTKVGEFFVTVKTTLNGVTTVSTLAFTVNENPFTGLYKGLTALDGRIGAAELSAAAGGTVKLTLKEGKTTYTANVKSFTWNGTNETGRAVFLLKATSADKKAGFPDREIEALMLSDGTATVCDVLSPGETCELFRTVKPTAEEMPSFTATYRFAKESGGPLAVLAVVYNAKKATASVKGKLADGTSVSMASIAVLSNGFLAPVQAVDKSGTAWVFDRLGFEDSAAVGAMSWMGEEAVETATAYGSDVTANPKPKFGAVVTEETTLDLVFEDAEESFRLVPNGKGGVAVYEAETAKPLLTVSSAFANGLLSFSFTSKTGDKAKYAVDLALDAEALPSGQVLRTWKDGSTSLSSAGAALLTAQQ